VSLPGPRVVISLTHTPVLASDPPATVALPGLTPLILLTLCSSPTDPPTSLRLVAQPQSREVMMCRLLIHLPRATTRLERLLPAQVPQPPRPGTRATPTTRAHPLHPTVRLPLYLPSQTFTRSHRHTSARIRTQNPAPARLKSCLTHRADVCRPTAHTAVPLDLSRLQPAQKTRKNAARHPTEDARLPRTEKSRRPTCARMRRSKFAP